MAREHTKPSAEKTIFILGPMTIQNELLANYLAKSTGAKCFTGESIQEPFSDGGGKSLILWDCQGRTSNSILAEIQHYPVEKHMVLLFNLSRGAVIEREAVNQGVRGFLYEHESFASLPKAVQTVLNGELWLSREFMSKWILSTRREGLKKDDDNGLTPKEVQIIRLIADGASNRDIAEELLISPNTAKTHVYNIFKKIKVVNRLQAALWAKKNF